MCIALEEDRLPSFRAAAAPAADLCELPEAPSGPPSARWRGWFLNPPFCKYHLKRTSLSEPLIGGQSCFRFTSPADRWAIFTLEWISPDSKKTTQKKKSEFASFLSSRGSLAAYPIVPISPVRTAAVKGGQIPVLRRAQANRPSEGGAGNLKKKERH